MLTKFDLKKLIIGTANFGQKYGLKKNKINHKEIFKIFNHSYKMGIRTIDTAINYGTSESVITKYRNKNKNWKIISKIPIIGNIVIPKEVGEGLFGISFKMKGLKDKIKTTINPLRTITPRFIQKIIDRNKATK